MKVIYSLIKLLVFAVLILLAITNTQTIGFNYLPGQSIHLPLIVLLLIFFIIGAVFGVLAMFGRLLKLRSEAGRLRGKIKKTSDAETKASSVSNETRAE
ncbi:LapA family protein [Neisseriaceae bacterium ESL0693]|nr:LapA family protein [Neisseriaceae bacterium ESL0693]